MTVRNAYQVKKNQHEVLYSRFNQLYLPRKMSSTIEDNELPKANVTRVLKSAVSCVRFEQEWAIS